MCFLKVVFIDDILIYGRMVAKYRMKNGQAMMCLCTCYYLNRETLVCIIVVLILRAAD